MRRDQRGPWISSIRASIAKYTQCIEQTERAKQTPNGYAFEPEEAKLANEVKTRLQERMSELVPHQSALKLQMSHLTRKINSVKEILGGNTPDKEIPQRRNSCAMENGAQRIPSALLSTSGTDAQSDVMSRRSSLNDELRAVSERVTERHRPRSTSSKASDDMRLHSRCSVDIRGLREKARMRKCQTPRPLENRRWLSSRPSLCTTSYREENRRKEATTPGRASLDTPFQSSSTGSDSGPPHDTGIWRSYQNLIDAVQNVLQKEVQTSLELEMENLALKRLLEMKGGEPSTNLDTSNLVSGSTSRSYSTAESEFDAALLEQSEDEEPNGVLCVKALEVKSSMQNDELINALEVVRRAEFIKRNSSKSEALVLNLQNAMPPKGFETDFDEESNLDLEDSCDLGVFEARTRLPAPRPIQRGFSVWSILQHAIGRDLTRITLPATINEPLSALQRFVEEFEHASLLTCAALCSDPHERLLRVTAFVLSSYHASLLRDSKPFNPLLGETFEWINDNFRFVGEQVSHHPPVSCFNVQGFDASHDDKIYEVHGEFELKSKFWGTTLNVFPTGRMELFLASTNERFVWNKACISIHNLILGQLWLDFHGDIQIQNMTTGDCAKIRLAKARGYGTDRGNIDGKILNAQQQEIYSIDGNFTKVVYAQKFSQSGREEIFRAKELPPNAVDQYNMTHFAVALNDPRGFESGDLPRTDSRLRPDVRALETGDFGFATSEKLRLEDKQRKARRARKENGQKYIPMWFSHRRPDVNETLKTADQEHPFGWKFRDDYWKRKAVRNWGGCPDIF